MKVVVIAPHLDDETLGVGGTIAKMIEQGHEVVIVILTGHGEEKHPLWPHASWDIVRAEALKAWAILGAKSHIFLDLPAAMMADHAVWKINEITKKLIDDLRPDILFVPFIYDLHKDHREAFHSLSVAWRTNSESGRNIKEIYCYEVNSETHWNFHAVEGGFLPNVWIDITNTLEKKLKSLVCYQSQIRAFPDCRSIDSIKALAQWRGSQVNVAAAEAFILVRKIG